LNISCIGAAIRIDITFERSSGINILLLLLGKYHLLHSESGGYHTWLCAETTPGKMKGHSAAKKATPGFD
ncbi:MAG: hypothetical protein M9904_08005, partial [Chitinophagaceae bacterium]|nr:hypothetical protein [Chitinophagaceae bacterium]